MTSVTVRWAGPSTADADSTYKIERTVNYADWTELDAAQASTSPYASPASTLDGSHSYGDATVSVADGTDFSSSGYGWVGDALIQWTGKSTNDLTGVTWHSGYGTYATGTAVYEAHESYADTVTIGLNAVVYRITHIDVDGNESAPAYLWYYYPPAPASSEHCVVIVNIGTDLGVEALDGVNVTAQLSNDTAWSTGGAVHLDSGQSAARTATTDAFGLAFFHCWKTSRQENLGSAASYTFVLNSGSTASLTVTAATIPDRDWVLLRDIGAV